MCVTMKQRIFFNLFIFLIVNLHPQNTFGYTFYLCYINSSDSNSVICKRASYSQAQCNGRDISVIGMTMYVIRNCNSSSQCGNGHQDCCSTESNETTPIPDSIKHLYTCTTVRCLGISLHELPRTGEYYQVLHIIYSCDSKTTSAGQSTSQAVTYPVSTSRTIPVETSVNHNLTYSIYTSTVSGSSKTIYFTPTLEINTTTSAFDSTDEDAGFPVAGYVIIPIVIVLVAVVIGIVWRYRRKCFGKQNDDSPSIKSEGICQSHATINKTYDASCVIRTTDEHPEYSEESGFDDYSEISTVDSNIQTNQETEYNVLNLKNRPVQSDPNYGLLSGRPVDPETFYFKVQKETSDSQEDTYNHIGETNKGETDFHTDNTYDSTRIASKDNDKAQEEDAYNHIAHTGEVFESSLRGSATYNKITSPKV